MAAVANNPKFAKKAGVPQGVGKEYLSADKGKKFTGGGEMKNMKAVAKKEVKGHEARMHGKKMAVGGKVMPDQANKGSAARGLDRAAAMSGRDFSGMGKPASTGLDRAAAMSGRTMPTTGKPAGMKKGGSCGTKKYAKGGGIEKKGKTKGKMV